MQVFCDAISDKFITSASKLACLMTSTSKLQFRQISYLLASFPPVGFQYVLGVKFRRLPIIVEKATSRNKRMGSPSSNHPTADDVNCLEKA
jgi:hypothetical protein